MGLLGSSRVLASDREFDGMGSHIWRIRRLSWSSCKVP